ncbi:hypothetical protein AJ80_00934 [Polytolypa hystricis UAMH7299]|uniref:Metallo-beta-lactamase domain-containing protein n=1 Tax=Polytolypa hystricis (strain UAMH7299) TaxID=1447883 RepID=A0A2B7Z1I4_POLH7|nr:hypothetical protein AJ80_00934 [Polytolypa hystricis UAMH7299]
MPNPESPPLQTFFHCSSDEGVSSVSTLIVGVKGAVLIDAPLLISDAKAVVEWIREKTSLPLKAIFVTHHHEDHYFSAHVILDAFPDARFFAAPKVCAGIEREYVHKVKFWLGKLGSKEISEAPRLPSAFEPSFFVLDGNMDSTIFLLGPVQGDTVDVTLYWLPRERTVVCGDAVHGRSTHVWVNEVETPETLRAWQRTLDLIESLNPSTIIPGHIDRGWALDAAADLEHTRSYLRLFSEKVTYSPTTLTVDELYDIFIRAFPQATKHTEFLVYHGLANQFGKGGKIWEENKQHDVAGRCQGQLEPYLL